MASSEREIILRRRAKLVAAAAVSVGLPAKDAHAQGGNGGTGASEGGGGQGGSGDGGTGPGGDGGSAEVAPEPCLCGPCAQTGSSASLDGAAVLATAAILAAMRRRRG